MATRAGTSAGAPPEGAPGPGPVRAPRLAAIASAGFAGGLALFTGLVVYLGIGEIARTLASAGSGLLWIALFHAVPILASALGWYTLLAPIVVPDLRTVLTARWIAESINQLLPALHVGGNVVRAQRLAASGVPGPLAGASVVVDITLHLFGQLVFTMLGLSLLLAGAGASGLDGGLVAGFVLSLAGAAAFYLTQRRGLFRAMTALLRRVFRSADWSSLAQHAEAMDAWIPRLYQHRRALLVSEFWHVASWVLGAGETWLALHFLGHPIDWKTAVVIESLGEAIRTISFPVPAALGVQEGGFVLLGGMFGLTPGVSMALSLAKRVRELALGIPGLLAWQIENAAGRRRAAPGER